MKKDSLKRNKEKTEEWRESWIGAWRKDDRGLKEIHTRRSWVREMSEHPGVPRITAKRQIVFWLVHCQFDVWVCDSVCITLWLFIWIIITVHNVLMIDPNSNIYSVHCSDNLKFVENIRSKIQSKGFTMDKGLMLIIVVRIIKCILAFDLQFLPNHIFFTQISHFVVGTVHLTLCNFRQCFVGINPFFSNSTHGKLLTGPIIFFVNFMFRVENDTGHWFV